MKDIIVKNLDPYFINVVANCKYSTANFIPKNLLNEHFYFFYISIGCYWVMKYLRYFVRICAKSRCEI